VTAVAAEPAIGSLQALLVEVRLHRTPEQLKMERGPRQRPDDGVTQEQVARALKISLRHYTAVETQSRTPSLQLLRRLAKVLQMDPGDRAALLDAVLD
jgi:DNA-binding XRE family transcriptional regulator